MGTPRTGQTEDAGVGMDVPRTALDTAANSRLLRDNGPLERPELHFHFSLSCIGDGNGNPLQCSCLENLRDGGAWWAAVYGVAQSRT